jgi:protein TonB
MHANVNPALHDLPLDQDELLHDRDRLSSDSSPRDGGRPVREIQAICAKHHLACGEPVNLAGFLRALGENKLLAMNFWSVVARLGDGRNGRALDTNEVLAAIMQGVTGQSLTEATAGSAQQGLLDKLARMLAGEDVQLPAEEPAAVHAEPAPPAADAQRSAPAPESPPSIPASSPLLTSTTRPRLVLEPEHPSAAQPAARRRERVREHAYDPAPDPPVSIPLADYAAADDDRRVPRRITAAVLALALAAGAGFLLTSGYQAWRQPDNSARDGISSFGGHAASAFDRVGAAFRAGFTSARAAWKGHPASPPSLASEAPPPQSEVTPPQPSADNNDAQPSSIVAPVNQSAQSAAPHTTSSHLSAPPESRPSYASPSEPDSAQADDSGANPADSDATPDSPGLVVPGLLMKDHLISSRFPIVPDAPNADRTTGLVVLQAVVTRHGTVEHIRAIEGPDSLRRAAIDAVASWRYRPYLLNGTPVDVTTTIAVDFSGND